MKIKKLLVAQPKPESDKSPYFDLAKKYSLQIDFIPLCHIEPVSCKEFRQERIEILSFNAVIFSSKTAIDHYFRMCEEMRLNVPDTMKYFCVTESIAFYLQKYIVYRKRKIFYGRSKISDMLDLFVKHSKDKFFIPGSENPKKEIMEFLDKHKLQYKQAMLYKNVSADLSDKLKKIDQEMIVFYSPAGVKSLFENFPKFKQKDMKVASFGEETARAVKDAGLKLDVQAPTPEAPSMTMALDQFLQKSNGKKA